LKQQTLSGYCVLYYFNITNLGAQLSLNEGQTSQNEGLRRTNYILVILEIKFQRSMSTIKPVLRIYDYDKTIEFYVNWLGFTIDWTHVFEEGMPRFMQVTLRDVSFYLSEHHGDGSPNSRVFVQEFKGLREYHKMLLDKKYKYNRPGIVVPEWDPETISVTVIDPVGNQITFTERNG
jgi:catechol 2,3-dioxygenase-like lactoylglutathione lyase family enzyme